MTSWEITTGIIVLILILGVIVLSVLRPSSRVRFGVFFERDIEDKDGDDQA